MRLFGKLLSIIFILAVLSLLVLYWFFPFREAEFSIGSTGNSNFSSNASVMVDMQFYDNMRYPSPNISYKIHKCPLPKSNEMELAFEILENKTVLNFYEVAFDEEISVTCESKSKIKEGLFIGGEGGPTNITKTDNFNVILSGSVLLIRETKCREPIIALHELLHALGFNHSSNKNNIMYPVVKCYQTMGEDTSDLINELYSHPSYPDLSFENVSASMKNRFLDLNMTIRNHGLEKSEEATVEIYADDKLIKEIKLDSLQVGTGRILILTNSLVTKINFDELRLFINADFDELDKQNNRITLQIKK